MRGVAAVIVIALLLAGCGDDEGPHASPAASEPLDPWREVTDAELDAEIAAAMERAAASDRRVLLDFVAPWCDDCREVVRVSRLEPARSVITERYEYVPVNVGHWDRARSWRERFAIRRIATLVVLEPDGTRVAQTTLEPISKRRELTPEMLAAWLREPRDEPVRR